MITDAHFSPIELEIFDRVCRFESIEVIQIGKHDTCDFELDLASAIEYVRLEQKAMLFAIAEKGRSIILCAEHLDFWLARRRVSTLKSRFKVRGKAAGISS